MSFIFDILPATPVTVQLAGVHFVFDQGIHVHVLVVADRIIHARLLLDPVRFGASLLNVLPARLLLVALFLDCLQLGACLQRALFVVILFVQRLVLPFRGRFGLALALHYPGQVEVQQLLVGRKQLVPCRSIDEL